MAENKLGVVVPYRDREQHLKEFIPAIGKVLEEQGIDYEIIIVEQADTKPFNRGKLLNIGVKKAFELECNYVALHDVDMIPVDVDYSKVDRPTHLATDFVGGERVTFDEYFGGVTLFPTLEFMRVNGYSNEYWGWGYEDDDLLWRCKVGGVGLNTKSIPLRTYNSAGFQFNGETSKIQVPKNFNLKNFTVLVSVEPEEIECRSDLDFDEYAIWTIPGFDTGLVYSSFNRYKFDTFNTRKENFTLKSDIVPPYRTVLAITANAYDKELKMYQDGVLVDEVEFTGRLMPYRNEEHIFLGIPGYSSVNSRRPFKGVIDYFAVWNHSLEPDQIKALSNNLHLGVTGEFEGYITPHCLEICLDMKISDGYKVKDLSGNGRDGELLDCTKVPVLHQEDYLQVPIPFRRNSTFRLLVHEDEGFLEGKWKHAETRTNQIKYFNEVKKNRTNPKRDGFDSIRTDSYVEVQFDDHHRIRVEL